MPRLVQFLGFRVFFRPGRGGLGRVRFLPRHLRDTVRDIIHRVEARHVLKLQEIDRVAFAFGKDGDQDIGARHFFPAGGLHMDRRALQHPLETGGRFGILAQHRDQIGEVVVDIIRQVACQLFHIDAAGPHDGNRVLILGKGQQEMFQRGVFVITLPGQRQGPVQRLFENLGQHIPVSLRFRSGLPDGDARLRPIRYLAKARPRRSDLKRPDRGRGKHGPLEPLFLLQRALKRVTFLAGHVHDLGRLCFGHLIGIDTADTDTAVVHVKHDLGRFFASLPEEPFQDVNDELHRRVVVVQHQNLVHGRFLGFGTRFGDDTRTRRTVPATVLIVPAVRTGGENPYVPIDRHCRFDRYFLYCRKPD